jgi:hypothetical protein
MRKPDSILIKLKALIGQLKNEPVRTVSTRPAARSRVFVGPSELRLELKSLTACSKKFTTGAHLNSSNTLPSKSALLRHMRGCSAACSPARHGRPPATAHGGGRPRPGRPGPAYQGHSKPANLNPRPPQPSRSYRRDYYRPAEDLRPSVKMRRRAGSGAGRRRRRLRMGTRTGTPHGAVTTVTVLGAAAAETPAGVLVRRAT